MKKIDRNKQNHNINTKLFAGFMAGAIAAIGFKAYADRIDTNEVSNDELNYNHEETINTFPSDTNYTYKEVEPKSDEYYRSIEIQGKTLNFVNTPSPTPTPNYDLIDAHTDEQIIGEDGIYPEGYLEYKERKDYSLNFKTTDQVISFYAKVFEIDEDIANKVINDCSESINGYDSIEEGIARTLCDLYDNPEDYGYSEEEIESVNGYELDYYLPEELIYRYCYDLDVNPSIALAIAYAESGRGINSDVYLNNNNVGGMVGSNGYMYFQNEATGLYKFVTFIHDRFGIDSDSNYNNIKYMARSYCEIPDHWINLVGSIYFELENYGYDYSYNEYSYQGRDLILCDEEDEESFYRSRYYSN